MLLIAFFPSFLKKTIELSLAFLWKLSIELLQFLDIRRLHFLFPGDGDSDDPAINPDEGNQDTSAAEKRLDLFNCLTQQLFLVIIYNGYALEFVCSISNAVSASSFL